MTSRWATPTCTDWQTDRPRPDSAGSSLSSIISPGVPSAPRNVVSVVNQTSVLLEWHTPRDVGHRFDLSYNVLCRRCHSNERRACQPCDDSVVFVPGRHGLKVLKVEISKLRAHTAYTFDVQVSLHTHRDLFKKKINYVSWTKWKVSLNEC